MSRDSLKNVMRLIDISNTSRPVEENFLNDLKVAIETIDSSNSRPPSKTYKPSSMQCMRNMWFQVTGATPDGPSSSYTGICICNSGSDIHTRIQNYIAEMEGIGIDCVYVDVADFVRSRNLSYLEIKARVGNEVKLYHKGLNMSFMTDGILRYRDRYYILEIKTETGTKFYSRSGVDPKHFDQATAYSIAFGLDDVVFLYVNRDMCDMKSFMLHVTQEMRDNLISRIRECDGYKERGIMPPKPEGLPKSVCNYCLYRKRCR